jgi:hypothetical protein
MSPAAVAAAAGNPIIDPVWYAKEMDALGARLSRDFPALPADMITMAVELASKRLAPGATIPNYLPVLVGRDARAQLLAYTADVAAK